MWLPQEESQGASLQPTNQVHTCSNLCGLAVKGVGRHSEEGAPLMCVLCGIVRVSCSYRVSRARIVLVSVPCWRRIGVHIVRILPHVS